VPDPHARIRTAPRPASIRPSPRERIQRRIATRGAERARKPPSKRANDAAHARKATLAKCGIAAIAHGSARFTFDLGIVYSREPDNIVRLVAALAPLSPRLRGAPEGLPFRLDARTITSGLNFTLSTDAGPIDLLGEVTGGGGYTQLAPHSQTASVFGTTCRVVSLDTLIRLKRAAGRPADLLAIAELELLRDGA
jgi:hypothetical protein